MADGKVKASRQTVYSTGRTAKTVKTIQFKPSRKLNPYGFSSSNESSTMGI